jgi:hypothetical protein
MLYHFISYQHVSITFAIITGVVLQEYKEYNSLPYGASGTIQCYNKCHKSLKPSFTAQQRPHFEAASMQQMTSKEPRSHELWVSRFSIIAKSGRQNAKMSTQHPRYPWPVVFTTGHISHFRDVRMRKMSNERWSSWTVGSRHGRSRFFRALKCRNELEGEKINLNCGFHYSAEVAFSGRQNAKNELKGA